MKEIDIKECAIEDAEYCIIDFETTGTSARNCRAIEIGMVKMKKNKIVDTYSSLINPGRIVPYYITELTGITNEDVYNAPYFEEIVDKVIAFIGDAVLTAHNMPFDFSFLKHEFQAAGREVVKNETLCTLKLARKLYPELSSKSLKSLTKHFNLRHRDVHRGLGDATVTAKILQKMFKAVKEEHNIETVGDLIAFQGPAKTNSNFRIIKKKLAEDLYSMPDHPGVYFFKNAKDEIIYIGKAKSLKKRVANYFSNTAARKSKEIVRKANRLGYKKTNTELTALLTEAGLIKIHKPRYNTMLKKYSQEYFIKVNLEQKFPDIEVVTEFDFDGSDYFGPYTSRDTAAKLKEIIDKTFQIRECDNKELAKGRKCYLHDIERCLAPCINKDIPEEYKDELQKVYEFLCGQNQSAINRLLNKMKDMAANQKYEEAAEIRDTVNLLLNQLSKSSILAEPINKANVLIEITEGDRKDYLLLIEGKLFIRNFELDEKDYFEDVLNDYFDGTIRLFKEIGKKNLEQIKITLSWLVKNKGCLRIHYLNSYQSAEEIFAFMSTPKRKFIKTL